METHILTLPPHKHWTFFSATQKLRKYILIGMLLILLAGTAYGVWQSFSLWKNYEHTFVPHTWVADQNIGGKTLAEAQALLQDTAIPTEYTLVVTTPETEIATSSAWLNLTTNLDPVLERAYQFGHRGSTLQQLWERWWGFVGFQRNYTLTYSYNEHQLDTWINTIAQITYRAGKHASVEWQGQNYTLDPGKHGQVLQAGNLRQALQDSIGHSASLAAPLEITHTPLSADALITAENRLEKLWPVSLTLQLNEATPPKEITPQTFFAWLDFPDGYREASMSSDLQELTADWTTPAQNAVFTLDENEQLTEFQPDRPGRTVLVPKLMTELQTILSQLGQPTSSETETPPDAETLHPTVSVPVEETPAEITLGETNTLGVKELLGQGVSTFFHSIPNRVYNVNLTSERLDSTLVKPGEEFSFNQSIGPVNSSTGYKSAYVIQNGRTVLGDGGGVCQVSTTVFRAALDAGFPITRWKPHSYRVGYYEQNTDPGYDATVYAPSVDFRFKNDTDHAIVISTSIDVPNRHLVIEIWGTSDGRTSTLSDYTIWNQRPAPAPLYQEDPSLPAGTTRQIDWAAPGANTRFTYTVNNKDGEEMYQREFASYFRPWQAVYLVGTGQ